jgi:hypothetical protein
MEITAGIAKGQLMTLTLLVLFILMLSILIAYVTMSASYGSIAQNVALSQAGSGYGSLLAPGLEALIRASASQAIQTLAVYEASPDLRNGNFITNASASLAGLITTGTLSGATAGTPAGNFVANSMQDLTLASYNAMLMNSINASYSVVSINQSGLMITQGSPYNLSISLVDNVAINASGSLYDYHIPINVTVPLNGTPDLYDAQRGSLRYLDIKRQGVPSPIGSRAEYANAVGFAYGTFVVIRGSDPTCTGTGNYLQYVPPALATAPLNKSVILVVPGDASSLDSAGCSNNYAGLVTNTFPSGGAIPGGIPWLVYPSAFSLSPFQTGGMGLLYGPLAEMLNISNVQAQAANGDFFASGYAPSYQSRASGSLATPSPYGLFTLQGLNYQAGSFNGQNSLITGPALQAKQSVSLWLKTGDASQQVFLDGGTCGTGSAYQLALTQAGGVGGSPAINTPGLYFSIGSSNVYIPNYDLADNGWHNIVASWGGGNTVYLGIDGNLPEGYVWNGISWGSLSSQPFALPSVPSPADSAILIGRGRCQAAGTGSVYFNGSIANVQLYGVQLTAGDIHRLYVDGIGSPPVGPSEPIAWWPLNGDSIDYSGNVNNGTEINTYISSSNLTAGTNSTTVPISSAHFNGANSLIFLGNTLSLQPESALTVSMWENASAPPSSAASLMLEGVPGYTPGSNTGYSLYLEPPGNVAFTVGQYGTPGSCSASGAANIIDGRVHFIAGVYNTSGIALYIDGAKEAGGACSSSSPINYGIDANGIIGSGSFGGNISNLQIYSTALGQKSIGALYSGGEAGFPLQQDNLTGWFPLDGDYGDYSLYQANAVPSNVAFTAQNAVTASLSHALGGIYGINFNGESGNILLPTMAASNAQTFSAWVYPFNTLGIGGIVSEEGTNLLVDNGLACFSVNAIGTGVCSASALPLQAWTFVTGTYNGSAETVYINGMVSNTMALTGSPPGAASGAIGFCVYCSNGGASTYLNGSIADVQIYGTALDRFQAFQLYHSQVPPASSAYLSMSWLP